MRKSVVAGLLALLIGQIWALTGCASEPTVPATEEYVRPIGRTCRIDDVTWLPQSGSGVEFAVTGTRLSIQMAGDDSVENDSGLHPRFAVLVDGEVVLDDTLSERTRTIEVFSEGAPKSAVVEVIHLSEANMGAVGVKSITVKSNEPAPVVPTAGKSMSIGFVGDSITCAYGVESTGEDDTSVTKTENFMKSYAYFAAKELDADYETVCYSGYGVYSGASADGTRNDQMLVPPLYGVVSKDYDEPWDFFANPNDVAVINLGTNDYTYTGTDEERMSEFAREYTSLIVRVHECNPKALIVCTIGTMGCEELYPSIEQAAADFTKQTGYERVVCYLSDPIDEETEGIGLMGHPTEITQQKSAHTLAEVIRKALGA